MEPDLQFHQMFNEQQQQKAMNNSGLTRYQSAPSSLFSNLLECDEFFNRPASPETERIFARFLASESNFSAQNQSFSAAPPAPEIKQESPARNEEEIAQQAQLLASINDDSVLSQQPGFFQSQSKPPLPDQSSGMDYRVAGTGRPPPVRSGGNASNLVRHNSSPAGLFSNITIEMENGFAVMRGMGDSTAPFSSASMARMSPIPETGHKNMAENTSKNDIFDYPMGSWGDDNASSSAIPKGLAEDNRTLSGLSVPETQNMESAIPAPPRLAHHLSLPKTAAEMSAIEKFLQDSVPCKIRAKRGFATHPRSIAERVRRTKISERMRKLQDLVPNMDKQTNTSDMLDLAVEYIKDLQRQVKTLSDSKANCTCDINIKQEL